MELGLNGKVALVTGAGQGVGREIGKVLAAEGALVAINDLFEDRARRVALEISDARGRAVGIRADVTQMEQVQAMLSKATAEFGPVDILVNNDGTPPEVYKGEIGSVRVIPLGWTVSMEFLFRRSGLSGEGSDAAANHERSGHRE